jgi:hypothetical protein
MGAMKALLALFQWVHKLMAILFAVASLVLIVLAVRIGAAALLDGFDEDAALAVIEAVGLLAAAVVALQISETIIEEEIIRDAHVSAPTRVRRFLSRFYVVVIVAMAIEGLVATFTAIHEDMSELPYAAALIAATALLLVAWGAFVWFNVRAEKLEPEQMERAKSEDRKVED